jgi:class 3 adenylate cyclase
MPRSNVHRRITTVLFLDVVGSTALAHELGDARWRVVLTRFRAAVRQQLKRHGGREQDNAGDGFFATFAEPAQALRSAAAITASVQDLGLDVRTGVHTGEVEEVDGTFGGIAVHIGARVMALAGPAEVLVTSTVKELVAGSGATFEDAGEHELKGVEGLWHTYRLKSIDVALPAPLTHEVAAERLAAVPSEQRRRGRMLVAVAAAVLLAAAVVGGIVATSRSSTPSGKITLLQLDPRTGHLVRTIRDGTLGCPCGANLFAINGTLWEQGGQDGRDIVLRDMKTGRLQRVTPAPVGSINGAVGFGSIWLLRSLRVAKNGHVPIHGVERLDELSGRTLARIHLPGDIENGTVEVGNGAVWVLQPDGTLDRIDPATNTVTGRFATKSKETSILLPAGGYEWICECKYHAVLRYDARTHSGTTFHFDEQPWHLVEINTTHGPTLWLMDEQGATLTQIDPRTGKPKQPLGLDGHPTQAAQIGGSIWIAAGTVVDRLKLSSRSRTSIQLPKGINATGIAADPTTGRLWLNNSYPLPPPN